MSIKILHMSDIHLDTPFGNLKGIDSNLRRNEIKNVFKEALEIGRRENVKLVLISGDFFDNDNIKKSTQEFLDEIFSTYSEMKFFISPGNHDPYHEYSIYKLMKFKDNVHIFKDEIEEVEINSEVSIYGAAFNSEKQEESLIKNSKIRDKDKINILVIHGDVAAKSTYNPITQNDIENFGATYTALGHIHKNTEINRIQNSFYAYSGSLTSRGFDETGYKGVIIGEISKDFVNLKFREINQRKYHIFSLDISNILSIEEILFNIEKISKDNNADIDKDFIRIVLSGNSKIDIRDDIITKKLKEKFYYIEIINNVVKYSLEMEENKVYEILKRKVKERDESDNVKKLSFEFLESVLNGREIEI